MIVIFDTPLPPICTCIYYIPLHPVLFNTPPLSHLYIKHTPSPLHAYLFGGGVLSWNVYLKIDMFHVERFVKKYNVPRHFNWCWYGVSLFIGPIPLEKKRGKLKN